ncbi:hypothetical protein EYZ11_007055 [Aspergillus tanneri]|uniref:Uncharacterized protein n=1 Tax=Aspergillus tanneri TaxID=1220188 RepID=A0A4S3JE85_9EURO|nr:hypothetical protein EYZ11_007055 [Aspergillus tanneri]
MALNLFKKYGAGFYPVYRQVSIAGALGVTLGLIFIQHPDDCE